MDELYGWGHRNASEQQRLEIAGRLVDDALGKVRQPLVEAVASFIGNPITAMNFFTFEVLLLNLVRELGRVLLQTVLQSLTPTDSGVLAKQLHYQSEIYSRRAPTRNANIATRFGNIVLWRHGYRTRDETIFPLEMMLGLTHSVSPALLDLLGKKLASAGMSQQATLTVIQELCGIRMGVKRLRKCIESLAESMESLREAAQVDKLLQLLEAAGASSGSRKPVLSVGRDGLLLRRSSRHHAASIPIWFLRSRCRSNRERLLLRRSSRLRPSRQTVGNGLLGLSTRVGTTDDGPDAY